MNKIKSSWDLLSEEKRKSVIDEIISYFSSERNEEIGIIAAENILDMFLQSVATDIYNKGVEDAKTILHDRLKEIEVDIEVSLKKD